MIDYQEAIKRSIQTEKNAMLFYHSAAQQTTDAGARAVFALLAREEREHASQFFALYAGNDLPPFAELMEAPALTESSWMQELLDSVGGRFTERKALELALDKEKKLEQSLREMAAKIDDPDVKKVYEANARSTLHHYQLIESEYARLMGMVHETEIDTFVRE